MDIYLYIHGVNPVFTVNVKNDDRNTFYEVYYGRSHLQCSLPNIHEAIFKVFSRSRGTIAMVSSDNIKGDMVSTDRAFNNTMRRAATPKSGGPLERGEAQTGLRYREMKCYGNDWGKDRADYVEHDYGELLAAKARFYSCVVGKVHKRRRWQLGSDFANAKVGPAVVRR